MIQQQIIVFSNSTAFGDNVTSAFHKIQNNTYTSFEVLSNAITQVANGIGINASVANGVAIVALQNTAVAPGAYTLASITVDATGRLTAASSGAAGGVAAIIADAPLSASEAGGTYTLSIASPAVANVIGSSPVTVANSGGTYTVGLAASGVVPGTYTLATVILDSQGIVTAASNGVASGGGAVGNVVTNYPLSNSVSNGTYTIGLSPSGVAAGTYMLANVTVDAQGIITNISNGVASGGGQQFIATGLSVPLVSSFTWTNQGTATAVNQTNGPLTFNIPYQSSDIYTVLYQSVRGSTPWTITAEIAATFVNNNFKYAGVALSDGTQYIGFCLLGQNGFDAAGTLLLVQHRTSSGGGISNPYYNLFQIPGPVVFLRINNDGTNNNYMVSGDGVTYQTVFSEGNSSFLTTSQVGLFADPANSQGGGITINVWGWENVSGNGTVLTF